MKKIIIFGLTGIFGIGLSVIYHAPANTVWQLFRDDIHVPGLKIYNIGGSVWDGTANIQYRDFPDSTVTWNLAFLPLFQGIAETKMKAVGTGHEFQASATVQDKTIWLNNLGGLLNSEYVNRVGHQYDLHFSGELRLDNLHITSDGVWFKEAAGQLHWTGGRVLYPAGPGFSAIELPPLDGKLELKEGKPGILVSHDDLPVMSITLDQEGLATLEFRARLFEVAKLPWVTEHNADDTVFIIEEKVL